MPKIKLRAFSTEWLNLFEWFEEHPDEPKIIPTQTEKQARTMRAEFYNARIAFQKESELASVYKQVQNREVVLEGAVVTFRNKERTPIAELIRRSLEEDTPKPLIRKPDGDASYDEGN